MLASAGRGFVYVQMIFSKALENTSSPGGSKHLLDIFVCSIHWLVFSSFVP